MNSTERFSRQASLVPAEKLAACKISVIGTGAIGRQVALQLAAIGAPSLKLFDHDDVEESNVASQGFKEGDIGKKKVFAVGDDCRAINGAINVEECGYRFRKTDDAGDVVFCCVDSIDTRKFIFNAVIDKLRFWTDGRMSAEVFRVLSVGLRSEEVEYYRTTLFHASEAYQGSCTAKTTIYCANIVAGYMVLQFAKWLRGVPYEQDISMNLLTAEMSVTDAKVPAAEETAEVAALAAV